MQLFIAKLKVAPSPLLSAPCPHSDTVSKRMSTRTAVLE